VFPKSHQYQRRTQNPQPFASTSLSEPVARVRQALARRGSSEHDSSCFFFCLHSDLFCICLTCFLLHLHVVCLTLLLLWFFCSVQLLIAPHPVILTCLLSFCKGSHDSGRDSSAFHFICGISSWRFILITWLITLPSNTWSYPSLCCLTILRSCPANVGIPLAKTLSIKSSSLNR
jgi:hypothetical protein